MFIHRFTLLSPGNEMEQSSVAYLYQLEPSLIAEPASSIRVERHPEKSGWLRLHLPYELVPSYLSTVRNIPGRHWDPVGKVWEIPYTKLTLRFLDHYLKQAVWVTFTPDPDIPDRLELVKPVQKPEGRQSYPPVRYEAAVIALEQCLLLKRYSWRTVKAYKHSLRQFLRHFEEVEPGQITRQQIDNYVAGLIRERNISESTQNQILSALKMYYAEVAGQEEKVRDLIRPKKPRRLPQVLSEDEVTRLLKATGNIKHRCILMLIYSAGLRLGEVLNLRISDIQSDRRRLFINGGKGKKDRYTLLSEKALELLKIYFEIYQPLDWVFEGATGGRYSERSVQNLFTRAKVKSGINPQATVHTLRHSFATHLLEKGVGLRYIQELLGHESSRTTEIYTHVTSKGIDKIKSPLDDLDL